jgi:hypothetical protein
VEDVDQTRKSAQIAPRLAGHDENPFARLEVLVLNAMAQCLVLSSI